jgi:hypothetical protein
MSDAESISFHGDRRRGVGAAFACVTPVGPLRSLDEMVVTEWEEGRALSVAHRGLVRGGGRFSLEDLRGATRLTWRERVEFPWFFAGPLGTVLPRPVLAGMWKKNLCRLTEVVTGP